jgi:hypothetical protein
MKKCYVKNERVSENQPKNQIFEVGNPEGLVPFFQKSPENFQDPGHRKQSQLVASFGVFENRKPRTRGIDESHVPF